ncbi:porin family protein [Bergeyella porcorum]
MKKLFLGAAIAVSSLSFAQQFGIKGGMNVSSLSKDAALSEQNSKIGFYAGAFVNVPVAESFSVQPEVIYNNLGSKVKQTNALETFEYARHFDYISVPVMFQYNATPEFYLEAGPQASFLVSTRHKAKAGNTSISNEVNKDNYNTFDFGLGLGAGYYFTKNIGITARYVAGFTDIYKNNSGDAVKNNNFQVGLAYKF